MDDTSRNSALASLRDALLKGREPPPARSVVGLAAYRWLVVSTVCIGAFMGQVDSSIAQLVLPRLELDFAARLSTVSWVAVAYLLTMAGFLPIFGRLADMFGRKLLYTGGFLLFVLGSALCGFAPNLAGADLVSRDPGHRRCAPVVQQRRHRGERGRPRAARPCARHDGGGAGGGPQRRSGDRRRGARYARMAMGVLDQRAVRSRGGSDRLVRDPGHQSHLSSSSASTGGARF